MIPDYEIVLKRFEEEAKKFEIELSELNDSLEMLSEDDYYQDGFYNGFSKAVHMLDRIYREEYEKLFEI